MGVAKLYKFIGEHDKLITGNFYTLSQYNEVSEAHEKALAARLIRYRYTEFDNDLLKKYYTRPQTNLENSSERLMAKWLRVKLTTIDSNYKEHHR